MCGYVCVGCCGLGQMETEVYTSSSTEHDRQTTVTNGEIGADKPVIVVGVCDSCCSYSQFFFVLFITLMLNVFWLC